MTYTKTYNMCDAPANDYMSVTANEQLATTAKGKLVYLVVWGKVYVILFPHCICLMDQRVGELTSGMDALSGSNEGPGIAEDAYK